MGQTITEKILSRVMGRSVLVGETIYPEPDLITVHDHYVVNFDRALKDFGVDRLYDPEKVFICTDHEPIAVSRAGAERQKNVRGIVKKYGIKHFFDAGRGGLGHVFAMEMGYIHPGMFVLGYDTHVTNYGAVGCLAVPVVTEISEVLACGSVWIRVPETVRVNLKGKMKPGIRIRDVAQKMISDLGADLVDYTVVEFAGPSLSDIGIDGRITLCNTPTEIGAKSEVVETDQVALSWLAPRVKGHIDPIASDSDATFKAVVDCDLGISEPQVAAPPRPDNVMGVSSVAGKPIDHAFIGSCASGTLTDLRDAFLILKGRKIHPRVRLIIVPGTQEIMVKAANEGMIQVFIEAGALVLPAGCGPCASGRYGPLAPGEVSVSTGTRNDPGRLGAEDAEIYLASPLTAAASAVAGRIVDPREFL
jgi:3-isopropylmalate/(R)-2-methylmalate dehydratase large subunit